MAAQKTLKTENKASKRQAEKAMSLAECSGKAQVEAQAKKQQLRQKAEDIKNKESHASQSEGIPKDKDGKMSRNVNDYIQLIETVSRVEYSRLPNHLIDYSEIVNIAAIAVHVLLTSNPNKDYNVTYLSTAIKWAIRNELRYRYKWYSLRQVETVEETDEDSGDPEAKGKIKEAVYNTILSVDGLMEAENPYELKDDSYTPAEESELSEMSKIIKACIARLPDREREVVEARFFKNMKMREIGDMFGISPSRTSRIVQAALDKIKVDLQRRGFTPEHFYA